MSFTLFGSLAFHGEKKECALTKKTQMVKKSFVPLLWTIEYQKLGRFTTTFLCRQLKKWPFRYHNITFQLYLLLHNRRKWAFGFKKVVLMLVTLQLGLDKYHSTSLMGGFNFP